MLALDPGDTPGGCQAVRALDQRCGARAGAQIEGLEGGRKLTEARLARRGVFGEDDLRLRDRGRAGALEKTDDGVHVPHLVIVKVVSTLRASPESTESTPANANP